MLQELKTIKLDEKTKHRIKSDVLAYANNGFVEKKQEGFFVIFPKFILQPAFIVSSLVLMLLGGGFLGVNASGKAAPGDSLYIAKIISEKTKYALTFDESEKIKLSLEFAGNRTSEIKEILKQPNQDNQKIEELAQSAKTEIQEAKKRIATKPIEKNNKVINNNANDIAKKENTIINGSSSDFITAGFEKATSGIQIYVQPTSTHDIGNVLEEVNKLIDNKDYEAADMKLKTAVDEAEK